MQKNFENFIKSENIVKWIYENKTKTGYGFTKFNPQTYEGEGIIYKNFKPVRRFRTQYSQKKLKLWIHCVENDFNSRCNIWENKGLVKDHPIMKQLL